MRVLALITSLILAGCASQEVTQSCIEPNWYEMGRRVGAAGRFLKQKPEETYRCTRQNLSLNYAEYENGYNAGLVEYCKPSNAFELAQNNQTYSYVCPKALEGRFLEAYVKGQFFRELQQDNARIDQKISSLSSEQSNPTNSIKIRETIRQLELRRASNIELAEEIELNL